MMRRRSSARWIQPCLGLALFVSGACRAGETPATGASTSGDSSGGDDPATLDPDPPIPEESAGEGAVCDIAAQDCPAGFKCAPALTSTDPWLIRAVCIPVADDPRAIGDECELEDPIANDGTSDPCDADSVCASIGGSSDHLTGVCLELCAAPSDSCSEPDHMCVVMYDGMFSVCMPSCHPLADACPETGACYYNPENVQFYCGPTLPGAGGEGDPCERIQNLCERGLACSLNVWGCGAEWCCTPYCNMTEPNSCDRAGEQCLSPEEAPPPGLENVGRCVIRD